MTCCRRSGNFWTIVTGLPEVKETPYIGAVVLNFVLQSLCGVLEEDSHEGTVESPSVERGEVGVVVSIDVVMFLIAGARVLIVASISGGKTTVLEVSWTFLVISLPSENNFER